MQQYFALMFGLELFGISGLAVGRIDLAGFGIIDDMGFQNSNLRHALFRRFDFFGQCVVAGGNLRCFCFEIGIVQ